LSRTNYWECQCNDCFYRWEFHEKVLYSDETEAETDSTEDEAIDPYNSDVVDAVFDGDISEGANAPIFDWFIAQSKLPRYVVRLRPEYCPRCWSPDIKLWSEGLLIYPKNYFSVFNKNVH